MKIIIILVCSLLVFNLSAQQKYSKVKINTSSEGLQKLIQLGVGIDHGITKEGVFFISDFSENDISIMKNNGYSIEILIEDVQKEYEIQNYRQTPRIEKKSDCFSEEKENLEKWEKPTKPSNFKLGTMGGYYTYQEFLNEVDLMASKFPDLIQPKAQIGDFLTNEGRPIYYLKISNNPSIDDENEPEILYSAVHHAREPQPLTGLIYYMWYLLENYSKDPEIKFLVDNTEMFFVPCLNPDGYIYNQITNPQGGGMHRKNMKNVGYLNRGVDLNRNYSYGWGTTGISFDENSDIYPGSGPFSEPETQAMRSFCRKRNFSFAFNTHSFSNLLLYPFGTTYEEIAKDNDYFISFTNEMVKYNHYNNMKSSGLYLASGDSDDYMYADDLENKPQIFAMTPEIGHSFWPAASEIENLCQEFFYPNLLLSYLSHSYYLIKDIGITNVDKPNGKFYFSMKRIGIKDKPVKISFEPLEGLKLLESDKDYNLVLDEYKVDSIGYSLNSTIKNGDKIKFVIVTNYGDRIVRDTIEKTFQLYDSTFVENANSINNWKGEWFLTDKDYFSAFNSFTDSPLGNSKKDTINNFEFDTIIDLTNANSSKVQFYAKWDIELGFDYCQFEVQVVGDSNWVSQCGKYTKRGGENIYTNQPKNEPLYDGTQLNWVLEEINLNDFIGQKIKVRFHLVTDQANEKDGFYVDDFKLMYSINNQSSGIEELSLGIKILPNPSDLVTDIYFNPSISKGEVVLFNQSGQIVRNYIINNTTSNISINCSELPEGIYFLNLLDSNQTIIPKKIVVIH